MPRARTTPGPDTLELPAFQVGDKLRVKSGTLSGSRAIAVRVRATVVVATTGRGDSVVLPYSAVTNYSLAARRAWAKMPKRAGRPKNETSRKRMVSLRLDEEVWSGLAEMVQSGRIKSREQAVNDCLRRQLEKLQRNPAAT